jgi:pyruvate/2-oxoglutarate dehydrogenase complex dihydrolipoamide acyltransferase (E2) component
MSESTPPAGRETPESSVSASLTRLFLVQLLAVVTITAVLTTLFVWLGNGGSTPGVTTGVGTARSGPAPATSSSPAATSSASAPAAPPSSAASAPPPSSPPASSASNRPEIVVLNQSGRNGLAGRVADRLRGAGWSVAKTAVFRGTVQTTTVYYPPGKRKAAREAADALPKKARILPRFSSLSRTRLTVVVTDDYPS